MKPKTLLFLGVADNIHVIRWASFFAKKGYNVHVATFSPGSIPHVSVHTFGSLKSPVLVRYVFGYLRLRRLISTLHPDILHVHYVAGYGIIAALTGFHPLFLTVWGSDIYRYPKRSFLRKLSIQHSLRRADIITGDSKDILGAVCQLGGDENKCHLIQWGVDLERFNLLDRHTNRKNRNLPPEVPLFIYTRGFGDALYHPECILEAAAEIHKTKPDVQFVFLGDGPLRDKMMNLATSYGISHVAIFPGAVPHEDIPSYLSAADAYIALPESDPTSVALLEAMASSLPVIVSDLPSNREWITDGDNGFLIPAGDRAGLIEKILILIENGNLRKRMGKKNQRLVQKKADHGRHMIQMNEIYSAWLHRSR